jgi:lysophospholipase L1-like esterase
MRPNSGGSLHGGERRRVDGAAGTVYGNTTTGTPTIAKATISGQTYFPHVIKVTAPASGNVHLLGISSEASATGLQVYNVSTPSANTEYYNSTSKLSWLSQVPNLSLIVYPLGTNDVQVMSVATTQANVSAFLSYAQANFPNTGVLFVTEPPRQAACTPGGQYACQSDVDNILKTTAYANGFPFLSLTDRWSNWATANAAGFMFDAVHPSTVGHADINAMVGDFLAESYATGVGATGTLAINQGVTGSGINLVAPSGVQPIINAGDQSSGTNIYLKYNKAINQGFVGVTGGTDALYLQTNGSNRLKIDQNGQISVMGTPGVNLEPFSMPSGSIFAAASADPGCTQTYNVGRIWFDNTTTTTVEKHCMNVSGTVQWVTK